MATLSRGKRSGLQIMVERFHQTTVENTKSYTFHFRGLKDMESDISSIEKRFAYGFLQKLLKWMEIAQEFIAHLGTVAQG